MFYKKAPLEDFLKLTAQKTLAMVPCFSKVAALSLKIGHQRRYFYVNLAKFCRTAFQ